MALNIVTDKKFDQALEWLAEKEAKTKSDIIRELVLERLANKRQGFQFGAAARLFAEKVPTSEEIRNELKEIDQDHDLD